MRVSSRLLASSRCGPRLTCSPLRSCETWSPTQNPTQVRQTVAQVLGINEIDVTVNRNTIPFDERSPFVTSGIRLGSPAMTMRGFDEDDFREVGQIIVRALQQDADLNGLRSRSEALCTKRPLYPGFRGFTTYVA